MKTLFEDVEENLREMGTRASRRKDRTEMNEQH